MFRLITTPRLPSLVAGTQPLTTSGQIGHVVHIPEHMLRSKPRSTNTTHAVEVAPKRAYDKPWLQQPVRAAVPSHASTSVTTQQGAVAPVSTTSSTPAPASATLTQTKPPAPQHPAVASRSGLTRPLAPHVSLITRLQGPSEHRRHSEFDPRMQW